MQHLEENILNIHGEAGRRWLDNLPKLISKLCDHWQLTHLTPVNNMTFHFVAKAMNATNQSVVLKIGCDRNVFTSEKYALNFFNSQGAVCLIDYIEEHRALLLQQALPGHSLKSRYPQYINEVINAYTNVVHKLHQHPVPTKHSFPHIGTWLAAIDNISKDKLPKHLLEKAIRLKNHLLHSSQSEHVLHGDLHLDNVLQNGDEWVIIDPKGVIGEAEFEIAAFDFICRDEFPDSQVKEILLHRIDLIAHHSQLNAQRLYDWVFVRLILCAAWLVEDNSDPTWAIELAEKCY